MSSVFEMNNVRSDSATIGNKVKATSPIVEVFSAMTQGKALPNYATKGMADGIADYITKLYQRSAQNDMSAVSELNEIRRFAIDPILMREMNLLSIYGNYRNIGYNESCEVEVPVFSNVTADIQAPGEDVKFPVNRKKRVPVPTVTVSSGHAVDYRKAQLGDMETENMLQEQVRVAIRNKAARYVMETVYNSIKNAGGVKFFAEDAGLTKTNVDAVIANVRRLGGPVTVTGDYAILAEFNGLAGYQGTTPAITGIPDSIMERIHSTGLMGMYNGAVLQEIPNPYDFYTMNADGDNFETVLPTGIAYVLPTGFASPIWTATRGGLTSFSGNDITTGEILTRYDLEVGAVVAPGRECTVGMIVDTNLTTF